MERHVPTNRNRVIRVLNKPSNLSLEIFNILSFLIGLCLLVSSLSKGLPLARGRVRPLRPYCRHPRLLAAPQLLY